MRIKTKTTTHNEVEQASNIFETYALQFYLKHLCRNATNDRHPSTDIRTQNHPHFQELICCQNTSSDFSRVASGGGPRTFCAPSWVMLQQALYEDYMGMQLKTNQKCVSAKYI